MTIHFTILAHQVSQTSLLSINHFPNIYIKSKWYSMKQTIKVVHYYYYYYYYYYYFERIIIIIIIFFEIEKFS